MSTQLNFSATRFLCLANSNLDFSEYTDIYITLCRYENVSLLFLGTDTF